MTGAPRTLTAGTVIGGDFRVIEPLNSGGMGAVYVVEQLSTGARRALKVMHPSIASDESARERFRTEARAGSAIPSDHVVQVIGAGFDTQSGNPWLVMELLAGRDLGAELEQKGHLSSSETLAIFRELCHALGAAHRAGIVHRDLKPENIFLAEARRASAAFMVKVLDFGIAKVVAEAQSSNTGAIGTPLYMSPEQTVAGERIAPFTDVWALGLIAYRLLTGTVFWKTARSDQPSSVSMLREVALDPIPLASVRAAESGVGGLLPAGFDAWFARCVARNPKDRFQNADELLAGLLPVLGEQEMTAQTTSGGRTPPETMDGEEDDQPPPLAGVRARRPWALGTAVSALLLGGVWAFSSQAESPELKKEATNRSRIQCPRDTAHIAGGQFQLGDVSRRVLVKDLCMDLDEVSAAEFRACVRGGQCSADGLDCSENKSSEEKSHPGAKERRVPMACVSFEQAAALCAARQMRLPTEEEWEWAARRGAEGAAYPWGNEAPGEQLCWSGGLERKQACALGSFPRGDSPEHVRDLAGNVSEWTSSTEKNGRRIVRGSSFADDEPAHIPSARRSSVPHDHRREELGFRCVKSP